MDENIHDVKLIFELGKPGRRALDLPKNDIPGNAGTRGGSAGGSSCGPAGGTSSASPIPEEFLREVPANLPEVSEVEAIRHFTGLSKRNHGVDSGFYPLGSCTMKYNPKVNEDVASLEGFNGVHPLQSPESAQGSLEVLHSMDRMLSEITGMARVSLQPAAGAHGELTGLMIIKAYHEHNGDKARTKIIVPDSAHGTNPASAAMTGFEVVEVKSGPTGGVDLDSLRAVVGDDTAGLMLTNPNTLGLFDENILKIAEIVHNAGGLLYYDGANANAIMGISRPGDMGFDVVHINLHKTFSTPHGGGGPGSGPVGVKEKLVPFLPAPTVELKEGKYALDYERPLSVGKVKSFYGNFNVVLKAYAYITKMGGQGLRQVSETAVLNANYMMNKLKEYYELPYERTCMHEFVLSGHRQNEKGVHTLDIAKRLLDFGYHPPTVYFPLIVNEAIMIEPTETESKETLDEFIETMIGIAKEAETDPDKVKNAPHTTVVSRLDEVGAARKPILKWSPET